MAVDIWSLGVVIASFECGGLPEYEPGWDSDPRGWVDAIQGHVTHHSEVQNSNLLRLLLDKMIVQDSEERSSADECHDAAQVLLESMAGIRQQEAREEKGTLTAILAEKDSSYSLRNVQRNSSNSSGRTIRPRRVCENPSCHRHAPGLETKLNASDLPNNRLSHDSTQKTIRQEWDSPKCMEETCVKVRPPMGVGSLRLSGLQESKIERKEQETGQGGRYSLSDPDTPRQTRKRGWSDGLGPSDPVPRSLKPVPSRVAAQRQANHSSEHVKVRRECHSDHIGGKRVE